MNAPPASSNAARRLGVYRDTDLVGWLTRAGSQEMSFRYAETYLASTHPQPISLSLPLQAEPFDLDTSRAWFANLLPEGEIRSHVARKVGVSERNEYALLEEIGGDCAGALQLLPEASSPASAGRLIPLPWADLEAKIATTPRPALLALLTLTGELRLSLAGAQDKLPVRLERGDLFLPGGNEASTHLLKISSGGFPDLVQNELFCLTLARAVGLTVAGAALATTRTPVLLVERYDRFEHGDERIGRLHQEDFCQALGVPPESKYENEGGPSLAALFRILARGSRSPLPDKRELLTWVIFNFLIGNADAHAKNVSFLYDDAERQGPRLAPFYDLVCTEIYDQLSSRLAHRIGGEYRPDRVAGRHWDRLAEAIGVNSKYLRRLGLDLCDRVEAATPALVAELGENRTGTETLTRIAQVIERRVGRLRVVLG